MKKPVPDSDPLASWRGHFSVESQRRGENYAREGRVEILANDGVRVSARVKGSGSDPYEVGIDLRSRRGDDVSCTCPAFVDRGPCKHVWAVLNVVLAGLAPRPASDASSSAAPRVRSWIEGVRRMEGAEGVLASETGESEPECRVDYVLVLDVPDARGHTVLETRRAKPLARGGFGKSSPFSLLAPRPDVALGIEDRQIAALMRGAKSFLLDMFYRPRNESRYYLDGEQTGALLPHLCATQRLRWARHGEESSAPLELDAGREWRPCATLERDEGGMLRLGARLERGEERVDASVVRGVLAGDFVVLDARILRARLGRGRAWFVALAKAPPPPFEPQDASELLLELARRELDAEPGPGLEGLIVARAPVPRLTLAAPKPADAGWGPVTGFVEFEYGTSRVLASDRRPLIPTGRAVLRRYFEVERALLDRPLELGATKTGAGEVQLDIERVPALVEGLATAGWVVEGEGSKWRTLGAPRIKVASGVDWLELEGEIDGMKGSEFPKLLAAVRRGESTIVLDDGSTGIVPQEWVDRWRSALSMGEVRGGKLRFRASQAWFVDLLLDEFVDAESRRVWNAQRERLASFRAVEASNEPPGFHGELRPYQREGLGWLEFLERQRFGGCLADDMGLGKTVQVLAWLQARRRREKRRSPTLIVAPKSLTHNWMSEAQRFVPELTALEYAGTDRERSRRAIERSDLVVTTYGTVRSDIEMLREVEFGAVVLDESQAIKNEASRTARAVRLLRADHRLALSGTPIENHVGELWSLFEFLNPGMLGRSSAFRQLSVETGSGSVGDARAAIAAAVRPFLLRRTKEQVLRDLPERFEQLVECDLESAQRKEYDELRDHFRRTVLEKKSDAELARDKFGILEMLLRLRQAACHPGLLDPARCDESSAKLDALFPMLEEVLDAGHKALVFSQFTSFLAIVRRRLDAQGANYAYLDGQSPARERAESVARFQSDPACKLFLISLKAGGTGLNLTAGDYVFLLDPWWNPAVEAQAIGRSHRIGQERRVFAYRLVCRATIEERVLDLQARKRELATAILDGDGTLVRDLTRADLERLLS